MPQATEKMTMSEAVIRYLMAQQTYWHEHKLPLFAGAFAIFGHGNVSCLGQALEKHQQAFPTYRGQNEQTMSLAALGYTKACRRRRIMMVTSSIGPGALNIVTAAGVGHANRLPLLILAGDTFASRAPDPVLQQMEHFHNPTITANDAFKAVTRYWDRITRPEQIISSLPQAVGVLTDAGVCGPVFLGLSQDAQAETYDYPLEFFQPRLHLPRRNLPDEDDLQDAVDLLKTAKKPLLISGGGVLYSQAEGALAEFAHYHHFPVVETVAGRGALTHDHPNNAGPLGVLGSDSANRLAAEADLLLAVGSRLQDFSTGSWSIFNPQAQIIHLNAARFDACKHRALPLVGDAKAGLQALSNSLGEWRLDQAWLKTAKKYYQGWNQYLDKNAKPPSKGLPGYAQVVRTINKIADPDDLALTAAGGLPGELCKNWKVKNPGTFDCEFGFSCMGYEIAGGYGARMARTEGDVIVFLGDGSYLMHNSELFSSIRTKHKLIVVLCDNNGYAIIERLQMAKGGEAFNNCWETSYGDPKARVNFVQHAQSLGLHAEEVTSLSGLETAFKKAKKAERSSVIYIRIEPHLWTDGGAAWWEVGTLQHSDKAKVKKARKEYEQGKQKQTL